MIFSWKSSISVQSTLPPRVKPKQTLCRESESSVFYTDFPAEKILRCGGGFRTFIFNTKTSSFSYSDYTLKSLYRLWLGECNKIWKSTDYITDIIILVCCSLSLFTHSERLRIWMLGVQVSPPAPAIATEYVNLIPYKLLICATFVPRCFLRWRHQSDTPPSKISL